MIRYNVSQGISLYYLPDELYEDHTQRTGNSTMVSGYSTRLLHRSLHLPAWLEYTTGSEASWYRVTRRIFRSKTPLR